MNSTLYPGDIAEVCGLKNAAKFNGSRGVILAKSKPDQNGNPRQPIRLFNFNGKILEAREINLKKSRDLDDWSYPQFGCSLMEMIRVKPHLVDEDSCSDFAVKMWAEMAEQGPAHPLYVDHRLNIRKTIKADEGRKLYWLALDAIGHHFLIEKNNGKYRLYQTFVAQWNYGYTAREWLYGDMRDQDSHAWSKWGGGKVLGNKDIDEILDIVIRWQSLLQKLLKGVLLHSVPGLNPEAIPYLQKRHGTPDDPMDMIQDAIQHITKWTDGYIKRIGPDGCTDFGLDPITRRVSLGRNDVDVMIGTPGNGEHIFSIPAGLYNQCDDLSREMTGEPFVPASFLLMLNTGVWWEALREPTTGSAVGFAFRGMDMDAVMSYDEGVQHAEQMSQNIRDELKMN